MRLKLYRERDRLSTIFLKSSNKIAVHITLQVSKTCVSTAAGWKLPTKDLDPRHLFLNSPGYNCFSKG